jgi:hypothetical protein
MSTWHSVQELFDCHHRTLPAGQTRDNDDASVGSDIPAMVRRTSDNSVLSENAVVCLEQCLRLAGVLLLRWNLFPGMNTYDYSGFPGDSGSPTMVKPCVWMRVILNAFACDHSTPIT